MIKKIIKKVVASVVKEPVEMVEVNTSEGVIKVKKSDYRAATLQVNGK